MILDNSVITFIGIFYRNTFLTKYFSYYFFNTAKAFRRSLFITDLDYVFIILKVENDPTEEQFVARVGTQKHCECNTNIRIRICKSLDRILGTFRFLGPGYLLELNIWSRIIHKCINCVPIILCIIRIIRAIVLLANIECQ